MKSFLIFVAGVAIGIGIHWFATQPKSGTTASDTRENMARGASNVSESLKETFNPDKIKEELSRTGQVVREKAGQASQAIADATANARITAEVKSKLVANSGLSAFKISVDTTDGVVTLSGTVSSYEQIDEAMNIALAVDGVHRVISTIQVKASA